MVLQPEKLLRLQEMCIYQRIPELTASYGAWKKQIDFKIFAIQPFHLQLIIKFQHQKNIINILQLNYSLIVGYFKYRLPNIILFSQDGVMICKSLISLTAQTFEGDEV